LFSFLVEIKGSGSAMKGKEARTDGVKGVIESFLRDVVKGRAGKA